MQNRVKECLQGSYFSDTGITSCKINVNRLWGDIFRYSEFKTALGTVVADAGIDEYQVTRVDVRLDTYDKDDYKRCSKLNRIIVSLLGTTYQTKNNYRCVDLFNNQQLSISVKNDYFQIEYYDKDRQSQGKDKAKSRLELRSLKVRIPPEEISDRFIEEWERRLDKSVEKYKEMQMKYNAELEQIYMRDKDNFPRSFKSINSFLMQYQECIFTKDQMIDLLQRFDEVKNPVNKAKNYKQKYGIEYYSIEDVKQAVDEIKRAVKVFFNS